MPNRKQPECCNQRHASASWWCRDSHWSPTVAAAAVTTSQQGNTAAAEPNYKLRYCFVASLVFFFSLSLFFFASYMLYLYPLSLGATNVYKALNTQWLIIGHSSGLSIQKQWLFSSSFFQRSVTSYHCNDSGSTKETGLDGSSLSSFM